jgi:hypothetical protein
MPYKSIPCFITIYGLFMVYLFVKVMFLLIIFNGGGVQELKTSTKKI